MVSRAPAGDPERLRQLGEGALVEAGAAVQGLRVGHEAGERAQVLAELRIAHVGGQRQALVAGRPPPAEQPDAEQEVDVPERRARGLARRRRRAPGTGRRPVVAVRRGQQVSHAPEPRRRRLSRADDRPRPQPARRAVGVGGVDPRLELGDHAEELVRLGAAGEEGAPELPPAGRQGGADLGRGARGEVDLVEGPRPVRRARGRGRPCRGCRPAGSRGRRPPPAWTG